MKQNFSLPKSKDPKAIPTRQKIFLVGTCTQQVLANLIKNIFIEENSYIAGT